MICHRWRSHHNKFRKLWVVPVFTILPAALPRSGGFDESSGFGKSGSFSNNGGFTNPAVLTRSATLPIRKSLFAPATLAKPLVCSDNL